ncbi:hypothetical protein [Adhaeribacter soli]|uniref:Uncharacterized protein n=1 Tax=Adhaeribacter soli TaxID=2607655 RepID=A0A5N1IXJ4_9BACT|nr:hypothetical protein [Adhaeribacter soli]KAA9338971.1 hypothetical protein F0P94_09275 [Adhaeribacter soli]
MRIQFLMFFLFFSLIGVAQPTHDCKKDTPGVQLFIKSNKEILVDLARFGGMPTRLNSNEFECFIIPENKIIQNKDRGFIDFGFFKSIKDFSDNYSKSREVPHMRFFITGINYKPGYISKNSKRNVYFIYISEFVIGTFYLDVSKVKKKKIVEIYCKECRNNEENGNRPPKIKAIDLTALFWKSNSN